MKSWTLLLPVVLALTSTARGEVLDTAQVAADAQWVIQVDVDAMRASTLVEKAYHAIVERHPKAEEHLNQVAGFAGFDPRQDLHGITLYGKKIGNREAVLLVHANVDQKKLGEKVLAAPDHKAETYGSYELHSWTIKRGKQSGQTVAGAFFKPTVLVFAPNVEALKAALDVLAGKSPALAKDSLLAAAVPAGAFLVARGINLSEAAAASPSPVLKQSDTLSLATGENHGEVFFNGKVTTKTPDAALQIKSVVEGGRAMALLHHGSDAEVAKTINRLAVNAVDKQVTVEFKAPMDEFATQAWKALQKVDEMRKEFRKNFEEKKAKPKHD